MTTAPLHKNQAGQPSKNGGEFASAPKEEAPEGLLTAPPAIAASPMDRFNSAAADVYSAQDALLDTAPSVIRELIQKDAPSAVSAVFTHGYNHGHNMGNDRKLTLESVIDRNGTVIDLSADVEGDISYIGNSFDDIDDVAQRPEFVRIPGTATQFTLDLTVEPATDGDVAADELDAIRQSQADDEALLTPTARRALTGYAAKEFPAAASVILTNVNGGPGSPYLVAQSILAADGTELWVRDWDDEFTDVTETLDGMAVALDRDMDSLEVVTSGWEREATWRVAV